MACQLSHGGIIIKQARHIFKRLRGALVAFRRGIVCVISFTYSSDNRKHCSVLVCNVLCVILKAIHLQFCWPETVLSSNIYHKLYDL